MKQDYLNAFSEKLELFLSFGINRSFWLSYIENRILIINFNDIHTPGTILQEWRKEFIEREYDFPNPAWSSLLCADMVFIYKDSFDISTVQIDINQLISDVINHLNHESNLQAK